MLSVEKSRTSKETRCQCSPSPSLLSPPARLALSLLRARTPRRRESRISRSAMEAAHDVAQLEYEIAQKTLTAVQTRIDAGTATLHELDDARLQASERFITLQDVTFELERSQLGVLRATGELEKWALGTP